MKLLTCFLSCFLAVAACKAQTAFNLVSTGNGKVEYASPSALGGKTDADSVDYNDFHGSPFWDDSWNPAALVLSSGTIVRADKVRLNFYTGEVHYKFDGGPEMVAESGIVKKVVFLSSKDSAKALAVFESFRDVASKYNTIVAPFCQVLNAGKVQLLKLTSVTLDKKFDYVSGKIINTFQSTVDYYLLKDNIFFPVKRLDKENILAFVMPGTDTESWLAANKNKLKTEGAVVGFLDYYNAGK